MKGDGVVGVNSIAWRLEDSTTFCFLASILSTEHGHISSVIMSSSDQEYTVVLMHHFPFYRMQGSARAL